MGSVDRVEGIWNGMFQIAGAINAGVSRIPVECLWIIDSENCFGNNCGLVNDVTGCLVDPSVLGNWENIVN